MLIYCCVVVMVALLQAYEEGQRNLNSSPVMGDFYCQRVSLWSGVPPSSEASMIKLSLIHI